MNCPFEQNDIVVCKDFKEAMRCAAEVFTEEQVNEEMYQNAFKTLIGKKLRIFRIDDWGTKAFLRFEKDKESTDWNFPYTMFELYENPNLNNSIPALFGISDYSQGDVNGV